MSQSLLWTPQSVQDEAEPSILQFRPRQPVQSPLTLEEAFRQFWLPEIAGRAKDTIGEYWTHLRRWEAFWASDAAAAVLLETGSGRTVKDRMTHPVLPGIERGDLLAWRTWLTRQVKPSGAALYTARTVNKHLGSVQTILQAAADRNTGQFPHKLTPLPVVKAARKLHLSYDEADALKRACRVATWPAGLPSPAPLYWETLIVGYCVYGFRTQELVRYEGSKQSLQWSDVREQAETPHPDGKAVWDLGWIVYLPEKQKAKKPDPLVLPVTAAFRTHLDALRSRCDVPADGALFPFPLANESFYRQWEAIVATAGIKPKPGLDGEQPEFQIRHLRKTAKTWLNNHGAKIGTPGIGDQIMGHADDRAPDAQSKISREHYDFAEDRVLHALTTLPLPESFQRPLYAGDRQMRLF